MLKVRKAEPFDAVVRLCWNAAPLPPFAHASYAPISYRNLTYSSDTGWPWLVTLIQADISKSRGDSGYSISTLTCLLLPAAWYVLNSCSA